MVKPTNGANKEDLILVPGPFTGDKSPASAREGQCDSRLPFQVLERQEKLDVGSRSLCTAKQVL